VPVRGLASGKSRLAAVLSADERRALNARLLVRTLDAIAQSKDAPASPGNALAPSWNALAHCIVVSADAEALELARSRGAHALDEGSDAGLNAALELARALAIARSAATLLILAADLPAVDAAALGRLHRAIPVHAAAVISDKTRTGTNGLLLPANANIRFAFGAGSLERHRAALEALGIDTRIWHDPALAFDLDTADDYAIWKSPRAAAP
jgi:2-phospho-L-lactate guanylyltransferase